LGDYSQRLVFNPKDYLKNLSGIKLTQSLAQHSIGNKIKLGYHEVEGCISKEM